MAGIGEKLRERALVLGLSDVEIARRVGLSQSRYANYVLGKREPDFGTLVKICRVLGTTPNFLLGFGEEEEVPSEAASIRKEIHRAMLPMDMPALQTAKTVIAALAEFGKKAPDAPGEDANATSAVASRPAAGWSDDAELAKHKANTMKMFRGIMLSENLQRPGIVYQNMPSHAAHPALFRLWQNFEGSTPDETVMIADSAFYSWQEKLGKYHQHDAYAYPGMVIEDAAGYWALEWKSGQDLPHGKITLMLERGGNCAEIEPATGRVSPGAWRVYDNILISVTTERNGEPFKTLIVNRKSPKDDEEQGYAITFPVSLLNDPACDLMSEGVSCFHARHTSEPVGEDASAANELLRASGLLQQWGCA